MNSDSFDSFIGTELKGLQSSFLLRDIEVFPTTSSKFVLINGKECLNFSSNNYLCYADHPEIKKAIVDAVENYGSGSGASRLISGTSHLHAELEIQIANFKSTEAAMFLSSGYVANLSTISAIIGPNDVVFSDELNHASIIDGIKLSKASKFIYDHNNVQQLKDLLENNRYKYGKSLIITDTIFSMDGDKANLTELVDLKYKHNCAIMIDEAHSTGIYGENGSGLACEFNLSGDIDIQMGTFSKALGVEGAYIAGSHNLIKYLQNKSRGFVYSTAPSPAIIGGAIQALKLIQEDSESRKNLWNNINYFKNLINSDTKNKLNTIPSDSAIFCFICKDENSVLSIKKRLIDKFNILVSAIRPPTVNQSRIRVCLNAKLDLSELDYLYNSLIQCF